MTYYPLILSQAGLDFIKGEEFFVPHAYQDSAGVWTIGYGSTKYWDGTSPKSGDTITEGDASALLKLDTTRRANAISALIRNPLNQNMQDAVISFCYNVGVAGFTKSTLLRLINQNQNDPAIADAFRMWTKITVGGVRKVLPGLINRRNKEVALYFKKT